MTPILSTMRLGLLAALLCASGAHAAPAAAAARTAAAAAKAEPLSTMAFGVINAAGRFDLSVNNAPASQVYMQLGSDSNYNILVGPEVTGNINITLKNTTVLEALESLRDLFGYDFRISGNRVFIQPNGVQTR